MGSSPTLGDLLFLLFADNIRKNRFIYSFSICIYVSHICSLSRLKLWSYNLAFLFLQVIFRMNLLTFLLCLVMNRPYQFYYFVPSISFWFIVQFIVLLLPPQVSNRHLSSIKDKYGKWEVLRYRCETMNHISLYRFSLKHDIVSEDVS